MRARLAPFAAAALLAACVPPPPVQTFPPGTGFGEPSQSTFGGPVPTGTGVGLDAAAARERREAELSGAVPTTDLLRPGTVGTRPLPTPIIEPDPTGARPTPGGGLDPSVIDAVEGAVNPGGLSAAPPANVPAISDEQDFDAVARRQTIASDAARIAENRAAYVQVAPQPLPTRPVETGPNIVSYAVGTANAVGQSVHRRSGILAANRLERACGRYPSPDAAQAAFLERGGPERDRLGLDPDGDGFACGWDPAPFRRAAGR
jgi:hypothetical protein